MKYEKWRFFLQLLTLAVLLFGVICNIETFHYMRAEIRALQDRVLTLELQGNTRETEYRR